MNIIIPMAGMGSRFSKVGIKTPKPLIEVNGKTLIEHAVESLSIEGKYIFITRKFEEEIYNEQLTQILKRLKPDSVEIQIDKITSGCSETCLFAKDFIDNDEELLITNCDQLLRWDSEKFLNFIKNKEIIDGLVVLFKSKDPKNSFASIGDGIVVELVEKKPISDNSLTGVHYWKRGSDFVESAKNLLNNFISNGLPECYISETYNYLIKNKKTIIPYFVSKNNFIPLGTPDDIQIYNGKIKEFYTEKPKTIFCDLDGTIMEHCHRYSELFKTEQNVLGGVIEKFNEWDSKGHKIILVTARKESSRKQTEDRLRDIGLCWDYLIMGVTSGVRVLINDKLNVLDKDRSVSINLITDSGFSNFEWDEFGL